MIAILDTMFLMYGVDLFENFEAVFAGENAGESLSRPGWLIIMIAFVALIFPFVNAPIEEMMYRGYAQIRMVRHFNKAWLGILISSIAFGLQHAFLAATVQGAIVYIAAFFVWGIGSGIIFHKQKRLMPIIFCHFLLNLAFSVFPFVFWVTGVY
jgi:hypothetical protein